tara:strand:+ start:3894 stop:4133 length:240 start_codon:yes stop_codon:yes gene_type:complete
MFMLFPFEQAGFTETEWEKVPRVKKCIVRSYFLNNRDVRQAAICDYYETSDFVHRTVKHYKLEDIPPLGIRVAGKLVSC